MENTEENLNGKSKSKSRKRYEIPKTATCNVCGEFPVYDYNKTIQKNSPFTLFYHHLLTIAWLTGPQLETYSYYYVC